MKSRPLTATNCGAVKHMFFHYLERSWKSLDIHFRMNQWELEMFLSKNANIKKATNSALATINLRHLSILFLDGGSSVHQIYPPSPGFGHPRELPVASLVRFACWHSRSRTWPREKIATNAREDRPVNPENRSVREVLHLVWIHPLSTQGCIKQERRCDPIYFCDHPVKLSTEL